MKKLLSMLNNPLLHFLAIGALVFALYGALRGSSADDSQRIEINEPELARMREMFTAQWQRPPTPTELDGIIEGFIREEILYREALAMGLDRDDTVVRRRLAQKIEFLADDLATRVEPTTEELERFLEESPERYELPARVSFSHVYFSEERRGANAEEDASAALTRIRAGASENEQGDPFMLQRDYPLRTQREAAELFGTEFASALFAMEPEVWDGPVPSSYGLHLVIVHQSTPSSTPELADVSRRLRNDLLAQRRSEANEALVDSFKQRYDIVVAGR
jgi:peptidyl-prolyl cis-trans isomerase C